MINSIDDILEQDHATETRKQLDEWEKPSQLPGLPPVQDFDPDAMLPKTLADWVNDVSHRMQCPKDYPGVAITVALSGALLRRCAIKPKQNDDWTVILTLWALVVGRPSAMKSPPVRKAMQFLENIQSLWAHEYKEQIKRYNAEMTSFEQAKKLYESLIKKAWVDNNKEEADRLAFELESLRPKEPVGKRLIISDATFQQVGVLLQNNPHGLLMARDEVKGWIKAMQREDKAEDRSFYTSAWDGDKPYVFDRISREQTEIKGLALSILGCIQPGPLSKIVEINGADDGDDGFITRFQIMVLPEDYPEKSWVDLEPNADVKQKVHAIFVRLANSDSEDNELGAFQKDEHDIPFVHFQDDAQELFRKCWEELESYPKQDLSPALESLLPKYHKLIAGLALLFHFADGNKGNVGIEHLRMAINWKDYSFSHAQRIYGSKSRIEDAMVKLAKKIESKHITDGMTFRQITRKKWSGLTDENTIKDALEELADLHWLRLVKPTTSTNGGRPSTKILLNPAFKNI